MVPSWIYLMNVVLVRQPASEAPFLLEAEQKPAIQPNCFVRCNANVVRPLPIFLRAELHRARRCHDSLAVAPKLCE